jgi:hypothetical protein
VRGTVTVYDCPPLRKPASAPTPPVVLFAKASTTTVDALAGLATPKQANIKELASNEVSTAFSTITPPKT